MSQMRRTTLVLDQNLFAALRRMAAEQTRTLSGVVNETIRIGLQQLQKPPQRKRIQLPTFDMGPPLVNVADREELYRVLDADEHPLSR